MRSSIHLFRIKLAFLLIVAICCNQAWLVMLALVISGLLDGIIAMSPLGRGGTEIVLTIGVLAIVCVTQPCSLWIADIFVRQRTRMNTLRHIPTARAISPANNRQPKESRCPRSSATTT